MQAAMKLRLALQKCSNGVRTFCSNGSQGLCKPPFNILFLGTDSFALETLKALHAHRLQPAENRIVSQLHVVSTSAKTPVANYAQKHDLFLLTWPPEQSSLDLYDIGVLVSFGRLVPRRVIAKFPLGIVNVHPSLLPRWRGASPIMHTVLNSDGETGASPIMHTVLNSDGETGVSIMAIQPAHFDTGPILRQNRRLVPEGSTVQSLATILAREGADLLMQTLPEIPQLLGTAEPQASSGATYAHKATPSMAWVNWEQHTCQQIKQQYRAIADMITLRTTWDQRTLKLMDLVLDSNEGFEPSPVHMNNASHISQPAGQRCGADSTTEAGKVVFDPVLQAICVRCLDGWVAFRSIVLKKKMSAADFHNGYLSKDKHKDVHFQSTPNGLFDCHYQDFIRRPKANRS